MADKITGNQEAFMREVRLDENGVMQTAHSERVGNLIQVKSAEDFFRLVKLDENGNLKITS